MNDLRRPAVFLDRDGVLNLDTGYAHRPEQIVWLPNVSSAIRHLNDAGYWVFVVTNQAGIAHGYYDEATVQALHAWMGEQLRQQGARVDEWRFCPHHPEGIIKAYCRVCECRKPGPGMILDLIRTWPVDVARSFMIGDRLTDVQAAEAAGLPGFMMGKQDLLAQVQQCRAICHIP